MKNTIRLSEHFTLQEFTRSATAERFHIANRPAGWQVSNMRHLCEEVLEPLRRQFGPIRITSGYRSVALNEAVGGVGRSQHLSGEAADLFLIDTETGRAYYRFILEHCQFDQLLFEHNRAGMMWLHVSCRADAELNRHQAFPNYVAGRRTAMA